MRWPTWIDELKARYLADEANVFVLHGAVEGTTFPIGDEQLDCIGVLQRFLARTRPIVGVLRPWPLPSRIEFDGIMDRTRFENLVKAHDFVEGRIEPLQETDPTEALARIWRALDTTGTDQAWLICDAQRIAPGHRKRVDPIPGAPGFLEWPREPSLRASNNLVVLLVPELGDLRTELLEGSATIAVAPPPDLTTTPSALPRFEDLDTSPPGAPERALPPDLEGALGDQPDPTLVPPDEEDLLQEPDEAPTPSAAALDPEELVPELRSALGRTLLAYDAAQRTALLPVMDATSQVLASHRPDHWGTLSFALDDDDQPAVSGPGAKAFLALWRGDITLDAAGSMIVKALPEDGPGDPPDIDATGLRVLAKRVAKALAAM
ncbi:MAG: hypothetical protein AAF602_29755 [Myxococcota bacterium]